MIKDKDVMVFDTKYKRMQFRGRDKFGAGDVDRCDFFQINTYMSYYQNQNYNVKVGGLLYPIKTKFNQDICHIETKFNQDICHSNNWFGDNSTKFIIDGIDLSSINDKSNMSNIASFEEIFVGRINNLLKQT